MLLRNCCDDPPCYVGVRPAAGVKLMTLLLYRHHWTQTHPVQRSHISLSQELETLHMSLFIISIIVIIISVYNRWMN